MALLATLSILPIALAISSETSTPRVRLGNEKALAEFPARLRGKRIGLVINHTSVLSDGMPLLKAFREAGINVSAIFSPEHGFSGIEEGGINVDGNINLQSGQIDITNNLNAGAFYVTGDSTIVGNLEVQGNIDYVNVVDLLVNDQSITLNYGNATARDAFIYVDRSGSALTNAHLKWNEVSDQWEIFDGTSTFKIPTSTDDLAEGSTNLYWKQSANNTTTGNVAASWFVGNVDGTTANITTINVTDMTITGNITTDGNIDGDL